jgi:hypothetical protein
MCDGEISSEEAAHASRVLEQVGAAQERGDLEARIDALEAVKRSHLNEFRILEAKMGRLPTACQDDGSAINKMMEESQECLFLFMQPSGKSACCPCLVDR